MRILALAIVLASCSSHKVKLDGGSAVDLATTSLPVDGATQSFDAAQSSGDAAMGPLETVHFIGRFNASSQFDWSASAIEASFSGTGISASMSDNGDNYFVAVIDGTAGTPFPTNSSGMYSLASNLSAGTHSVLLYRLTEGFFSTVTWKGFNVTGGALVGKSYSPVRRIQIVGDSISCGYGDEGTYPCSFSAATENEYLAYGGVTARALNAEQTVVAWSGKGMYRNNDGTTTETIPTLYENTIAVDDTSTYAFTDPAPDVIVINLGTNDFAMGDPGQTNFVGAYENFIAMLRTHYPNAWIFTALGPMLGDPSFTTCKGYLQTVVSDRMKVGDDKVVYVEFPTQDTSKGVGCDYHPTVAEHQIMANILVPAIKSKLGW